MDLRALDLQVGINYFKIYGDALHVGVVIFW
jgi:hypothetical protein